MVIFWGMRHLMTKGFHGTIRDEYILVLIALIQPLLSKQCALWQDG
jgi:hypothetical protein